MSNFLARKKRIYMYEAKKTKALKEAAEASKREEIESLAKEYNITISDYKDETHFKLTGKVKDLDSFWEKMKEKNLYTESLCQLNESAEIEIPAIPESGDAIGISSMLNSLIKDELEAIDGYNGAVSTLQSLENPSKYDGIIKILSDISGEENIHIGQLQEALKTVNEQAELIATGEEEAKEQLSDSSVEPTQEVVEESVEDDVRLSGDLGKIRAFLKSTEEVIEKNVDNSYADEGIDDLAMDIYETYVNMKGDLLYRVIVDDLPDEELTIWYIDKDNNATELFKGNKDAFIQEVKLQSVTADNILDVIGVQKED